MKYHLWLFLVFIYSCQKIQENCPYEDIPKKPVVISAKPGMYIPVDPKRFERLQNSGVYFILPDGRDSVCLSIERINNTLCVLVPLLKDTASDSIYHGDILLKFTEFVEDETAKTKPISYLQKTISCEHWYIEKNDTLSGGAVGAITNQFLDAMLSKVRPSSCYSHDQSVEDVRLTMHLIDSSVAAGFTGLSLTDDPEQPVTKLFRKPQKQNSLIKTHFIKSVDYFIAAAALDESLNKTAVARVADSVRVRLETMDEKRIRQIALAIQGAGRISETLRSYCIDCIE